jgi:hypothetical protein
VPARPRGLDEMTADEARSAEDDDSHATIIRNPAVARSDQLVRSARAAPKRSRTARFSMRDSASA